MTRRCEQLREQALQHGLDSKAGLAWRIHSRSCEHCRISLFLLEAMEQQAIRERQHLGHDEVATLLAAVKRQHLQPHHGRRLLRWATPLAALLAVMVSAGWFSGGNQKARQLWQTAVVTRELHRGIAAEDNSFLELMTPAVEEKLRRVRRQVHHRRHRVLQMIEIDLGEPPTQDKHHDLPQA